jgi:hypothetical protein
MRHHHVVQLSAEALVGPEDNGPELPAAAIPMRQRAVGHVAQGDFQPLLDGPVVFGHRMRGPLIDTDIQPRQHFHRLYQGLHLPGDVNRPLQGFDGFHSPVTAFPANSISASQSASPSFSPFSTKS